MAMRTIATRSTVEVTDSSRRTIFGKGSVLAARQVRSETYVWLDRGWYQYRRCGKDQSCRRRRLDGRAVEAKGKVTVFKLTYAHDGTPKEESVHEADVALKDEPVQTHDHMVEARAVSRGGEAHGRCQA